MLLNQLAVIAAHANEDNAYFPFCISHMFPALVGMNRLLASQPKAVLHVPRIRGDEPPAAHIAVETLQCSPRAWG